MSVLEMTGKQFVEYKLGRDFTGQEFYDSPAIYIGFSTNTLVQKNYIQHDFLFF